MRFRLTWIKDGTSRISQGDKFIALIKPSRGIPTVNWESITFIKLHVTAIMNEDGHVYFYSLTVYKYDTFYAQSLHLNILLALNVLKLALDVHFIVSSRVIFLWLKYVSIEAPSKCVSCSQALVCLTCFQINAGALIFPWHSIPAVA